MKKDFACKQQMYIWIIGIKQTKMHAKLIKADKNAILVLVRLLTYFLGQIATTTPPALSRPYFVRNLQGVKDLIVAVIFENNPEFGIDKWSLSL